MTEGSGAGLASRRFSRPLMVSGLGFWGLSLGGALAPPVMRTILYPNHTEAPHFDLVAADPFGAPILWTALVVWCLSWTFVMGHVSTAWASHQGHPSWAAPALLLLSLASPLVFDFAVPVLHRLVTRISYPDNSVVPFLPAVVLQLVISQGYSQLAGFRPRFRLRRANGA